MSWEAAPVGQTAQSSPLTRANFDSMLDQLDEVDPYGDSWEIVRFPHWRVEWLEVVFVEPGSRAADLTDRLRARLAGYPCLNEDKWVEYEVGNDA